jgi:hypothetical protein
LWCHSTAKATSGHWRKLVNRIAHCCCGSLSAEALADPIVILACHCLECQRRTGSPFQVGAYFLKEHVRTEGPSKVYVREGQEGREVRLHFCPDCGTTVYWDFVARPDWLAVAAGTFADPSLPQPTISIWEATRPRGSSSATSWSTSREAPPLAPANN